MKPLISVIMSVKNGMPFVVEAVESILKQTIKDFEFLIIDDASTDQTWNFLSEITESDERITVFKNTKNLGLTENLNKLLLHTKGTFIARQDADDVSNPQRFERQIEFFEKNLNVGLLGTAYFLIDSNGKLIENYSQPLSELEIKWQMLFHNAFCHTSVMIRNEILKKYQLKYDTNFKYSQDYELWLRVLQKTTAANLSETLVSFRKHSESINSEHSIEQKQLAEQISFNAIKDECSELNLNYETTCKFREWYFNFPDKFLDEEKRLFIDYVKLFLCFFEKNDVSKEKSIDLHSQFLKQILQKKTFYKIKLLIDNGLFKKLISEIPFKIIMKSSFTAIINKLKLS